MGWTSLLNLLSSHSPFSTLIDQSQSLSLPSSPPPPIINLNLDFTYERKQNICLGLVISCNIMISSIPIFCKYKFFSLQLNKVPLCPTSTFSLSTLCLWTSRFFLYLSYWNFLLYIFKVLMLFWIHSKKTKEESFLLPFLLSTISTLPLPPFSLSKSNSW